MVAEVGNTTIIIENVGNKLMKSALVLLQEVQRNASGTASQLAEYICAHPNDVCGMDVRTLAEQTYTSPSSVVRLCRTLGFSGYKEFRRAFLLEIASLGTETNHKEKQLTRQDSIADIIDTVTEKNIQVLYDSRHILNAETVEECVLLLRRSRCILLFGIGASLCAAKDAYLKFLRLNKPCIVNEDWHSQLLQARNAAPEDVGIVFSYSGQTQEMVECMRALKENGTPCIAITRFAPSQVAKLADHLLYIAANESLFRNGAMFSRLAQLNVVDILYTAFASAEYDHCLHQLARTHIQKPSP